jgi:hypothetical protein
VVAYVRFDFPTAVTITEVGIANGFQAVDQLGDQFTKNNRIASGRLRFAPDGAERAIELPITFEPNRRGLVQHRGRAAASCRPSDVSATSRGGHHRGATARGRSAGRAGGP